MPSAMAAPFMPEDARAEDDHLGRVDAGHPADSTPRPPPSRVEVVRPDLGGHPARHLGHGASSGSDLSGSSTVS